MARGTRAAYLKIAWDMIEMAVEELTSADSFYATMRDTPYYIPRSVARETWSEYGRQTGWESYRLRRDPDLPLMRRFFQYEHYGIDSPYMVKIRISGIDPETGKEWIKRPTIFYDHLPNQAEIDLDSQYAIDQYTPEGIDPLATVGRVVGLHADVDMLTAGW